MNTALSNLQRAQILTAALPYIQQYSGQIVVVKYGGNAMVNETLKQQVMEDIVLLSLVGVKVVLVHGGGPEINELSAKLGKKSQFVNGLRVTDSETLDIALMVLTGKVNKTLVNLLGTKGGKAIGLSGIDGQLIQAKMKDPQLGYVGKITSVNIKPVTDLLANGYIPVISTIGCDKEGNIYNINGDTAAAFVAGALGANRLIMMTDIAGVMKDKDDPTSLIPVLTISQAKELFEQKIIAGGMIPKVECCIDAIQKGVKSVSIMDGTIPHSILMELLTDEGAGTMVTPD